MASRRERRELPATDVDPFAIVTADFTGDSILDMATAASGVAGSYFQGKGRVDDEHVKPVLIASPVKNRLESDTH